VEDLKSLLERLALYLRPEGLGFTANKDNITSNIFLYCLSSFNQLFWFTVMPPFFPQIVYLLPPYMLPKLASYTKTTPRCSNDSHIAPFFSSKHQSKILRSVLLLAGM
jgi:hypothetical protein